MNTFLICMVALIPSLALAASPSKEEAEAVQSLKNHFLSESFSPAKFPKDGKIQEKKVVTTGPLKAAHLAECGIHPVQLPEELNLTVVPAKKPGYQMCTLVKKGASIGSISWSELDLGANFDPDRPEKLAAIQKQAQTDSNGALKRAAELNKSDIELANRVMRVSADEFKNATLLKDANFLSVALLTKALIATEFFQPDVTTREIVVNGRPVFESVNKQVKFGQYQYYLWTTASKLRLVSVRLNDSSDRDLIFSVLSQVN